MKVIRGPTIVSVGWLPAPTLITAPVVSGTVVVGQTLSVTNGTWTGVPTSYARQWRRGGANISGATATTYVLVTADIGSMISCAVTATNANGDSVPAISNSLGPVLGADDIFLSALPSGFTGAWIADTYSATPRPHIPNLQTPVAAPKNLFTAGRRWFDAQMAFWSSFGGATIVDNAVAGPDGLTEASTINLPNGAYLKKDITLPAGTYTMGISVASNSGTDQTGSIATFGTGTTVFTVLASGAWQEVKQTFTVTAGLKTLAPVQATSGAINLRICNARLYAGSVDFGPEPLGGHILLGKDAFDASVGSVSSGTWNMTAAYALVQFPTAAAASASHTFMAVVAKVAAGSTNHAMFISKPISGGNAELAAFLESSTINIGAAFQYGGSGTIQSQYPNAPQVMLGDGYHVIIWRYDVATGFRDVWFDGHLFNRVTSAALPTKAFLDFVLGAYVSQTLLTGHRFAGGVYWPRALTDAEIR